MFHCGSRGFGHQVATDYLQRFLRGDEPEVRHPGASTASSPARPSTPTRAQAYFAAMNCAANMAFANRQVILHRIREVLLGRVRSARPRISACDQVYDVAHNTAKLERHAVDGGRERELLVHRKGATRAFAPGHPELPAAYRETGQPVILGGSMETGSYLLAGVASGGEELLQHGARQRSHHEPHARAQARARRQAAPGHGGARHLRARGVGCAASPRRRASPTSRSTRWWRRRSSRALSRRVARLVPVGNVKG